MANYTKSYYVLKTGQTEFDDVENRIFTAVTNAGMHCDKWCDPLINTGETEYACTIKYESYPYWGVITGALTQDEYDNKTKLDMDDPSWFPPFSGI